MTKAYNIWTVKENGESPSWSFGPVPADGPRHALVVANKMRSPHSSLLLDGDTVLVAGEEGGHGEAGVFRISRPSEPTYQAGGVQVVTLSD